MPPNLHSFGIRGCCRGTETNAVTGESAKGNVWRRATETDETKYVQGSIETKEIRPTGAIRSVYFCGCY